MKKWFTALFYIINDSIYRHRVALFWITLTIIIVSIILGGNALLKQNDELKDFLFCLWAVASLLIGSIIFMQLQGKKKMHGIKELMNILIGMIDETKNEDVYIITPNLNIGQSQVPKYFNKLTGAIERATKRQKGKKEITETAENKRETVKIHFCIWGELDNELLTFDLNKDVDDVKALRDDAWNKNPYIEEVYERLKKANTDVGGNGHDLRNKLYEYNNFINLISILKQQGKIFCYKMNKPSEGVDPFFLVCNSQRIYISSIDSNNISSADIIDEKGFIEAILQNIKSTYFNNKIPCH